MAYFIPRVGMGQTVVQELDTDDNYQVGALAASKCEASWADLTATAYAPRLPGSDDAFLNMMVTCTVQSAGKYKLVGVFLRNQQVSDVPMPYEITGTALAEAQGVSMQPCWATKRGNTAITQSVDGNSVNVPVLLPCNPDFSSATHSYSSLNCILIRRIQSVVPTTDTGGNNTADRAARPLFIGWKLSASGTNAVRARVHVQVRRVVQPVQSWDSQR